MNAIKGIYHDGIVEPIEKPKADDLTEVIIIFPDTGKKVKKLGGLYKNHEIDFKNIKQDLKNLSKNSEKHLLDK